MTFYDAVKKRQKALGTHVCLGLDPRDIPAGALLDWGRDLMETVRERICCIKPNPAFYLAGGADGFNALKETVSAAHEMNIPVLLDAKFGDIGSTAGAYAETAFKVLKADAVTLNPLLGLDSITPFLAYEDKGFFILGRTSNPSGDEFQALGLKDGRPLFHKIVENGTGWDERIGFVAGATRPGAIKEIRTIAPEAWLLLPGLGPQGGDPEATVKAAGKNFILPVSRAIANADDPAAAARHITDISRRGSA